MQMKSSDLKFDGDRTIVIAEAGANHNGSMELALALVDAAATANADFVKFQTYKTQSVLTNRAQKAEYQQTTGNADENQLDAARAIELSTENFSLISEYCRKKSIGFISTPFDNASVDFLIENLHVPFIKISSGDLTNAPMLLHIARHKQPILLSTGMATLGEIEDALGVIAFGYCNDELASPNLAAFRTSYFSEKGQHELKKNVGILHCTTEYPTPFDSVNLLAMDTLRQCFNLPVGYSDHSVGIHVAIAAVARGASIIEKHLTMDRGLPGPDHKASIEPDEFRKMVQMIRDTELALGSSIKFPTLSEAKNMTPARRSIVATKRIARGQTLQLEMLAAKRPGDGVAPIHFWDLVGKVAQSDYNVDDPIGSTFG